MRSRSRRRSPGPLARGWCSTASATGCTCAWRAVAEAWTALLATPTWDDFVEGALDGERAHPASSLPLSEDRRLDGLWRTWTIACGREGIDHPSPDRLPRLFTIDRATGAPEGVAWELATARGGPPFTPTAGPEPTTVCAFAPSGNEALIHTPWGVPPDKRGI
jgi:hypothetical protein